MDYEFSFVLPCLNEEKSLAFCINEIKNYISVHSLNAEILVTDNDSTDKSRERPHSESMDHSHSRTRNGSCSHRYP